MINDLIVKVFLDNEGKVKQLPSKLLKYDEVIKYLFTKFDVNKEYAEIEVNFVIRKWSIDIDFVQVRRSLVDYGYLNRSSDGRKYLVNKEKFEEITSQNEGD